MDGRRNILGKGNGGKGGKELRRKRRKKYFAV